MSIPKSFVPDKSLGITPPSFIPDTAKDVDISGLDMAQVSQLKASEGFGGVKGFGVGIAKGGISTLFGAGQIGTKIGRALLPKFAEPKEPTVFEREKPEALEPKGTAEKFGFFTEQVAELAIPAGATAKAARAGIGVGTVAKAGARAGIQAGTVGGITALQEGELNKKVGFAAGLAGGLTLLGSTFSWALGKITKGNTPEALMRSALRQPPTDLKKEVAKKAPILSQQMLKEGVRGSENKILSTSYTGLDASEKALDKIMASKTGDKLLKTKELAKSLNEIVRKHSNLFGTEGTTAIETVRTNILKKGSTITLRETLRLKKDIYGILSDAAFKADATLGQKAEALRTVGGAARKWITKLSPKAGELATEQQKWIRVAQAMEGQMSRAGRNIIGLHESILSAGGSAKGLALGLGRRLFETTQAKTSIAVGLDKLGGLIQKLPTDAAGNIAKSAVIKLLQGF